MAHLIATVSYQPTDMPIGPERDKVLGGLARKRGRPHRYTYYRWAIGIAFTAAIAALSLFDVMRFDLWRGRHMYMGEELGFIEAAKAFAFPFLGINVAIVIASRFIGRYLCGFVCPYGALARFREWFRFHGKTRAQRLAGHLTVLGVSLLLCAITFSFWVDWHVFLEGSARAKAISGGVLGAMTLGLYGTLHFLGQRFCREYCPSGVYFAVLGHTSFNGIEFAHPESCTECKACEKVCPSDLSPKEMAGGEYRGGMGFYGEAMSNFALCIRCGDCVAACEGMTARFSEDTPLRMGWLRTPESREYKPGARTDFQGLLDPKLKRRQAEAARAEASSEEPAS